MASESHASTLEGGFADPVFDSQAVFSKLMTALSRPGTVVALDGFAAPPAPLCQAAGATLLTLADADTPVWLDETASAGAIGQWLAFHAGAPLAPARNDARFAVVTHPQASSLDGFSIGTPQYPDRSTTLLLSVDDLAGGDEFVMSGPGIDGERTVRIGGLPAGFTESWAGNRRLYPCGVDLLLVCGPCLVGLPRTTLVVKV